MEASTTLTPSDDSKIPDLDYSLMDLQVMGSRLQVLESIDAVLEYRRSVNESAKRPMHTSHSFCYLHVEWWYSLRSQSKALKDGTRR